MNEQAGGVSLRSDEGSAPARCVASKPSTALPGERPRLRARLDIPHMLCSCRMAPERDIEEAGRIVLERLRNHPARVFLLGSCARGDARRYSDIDIAILPAEPLPPELLFEIEEALEESDVLYPVDLVDLSVAPAPLRERVPRAGVPWNVCERETADRPAGAVPL